MDTIERRRMRMRRRLHALRHDERGFTLVEMMVAILLLAIIFAALAQVIITSLTAVQRDEQRVRATQLAQEELERLRAIEWDCVAFDTSDSDYVATYNGNATVELVAADCSDPTIAPDPSAQVRTVDGIDYTVQPNVYWIDDDEDGTAATGDADPHDYKEFTVDVSWTLRGQSYTHSDTSTRAPTVEEVPLETATTAGFEITSMTVNPVTVTTTSGATTSAITVIVETSAAATLVQLAVPTSSYGTATLSDISSTAGTRWQVTIPSGSTQFPVGTHEFVVTATGSLGADTASRQVTFANAPVVTPVTINTPLLSPSAPICVANSSKRSYASVIVTVDIDGVSVTDDVDVSWTDDSGSATVVATGPTANGARFTAVIPAGTRFGRSTTTLKIDARRISDNTVAQGTYSISVTRENNMQNCP